jgi:hypothetical protein
MKSKILGLLLFICLISVSCLAKDKFEDPISYRIDLSKPFTTYEVTAEDRAETESAVQVFNYKGKIYYFGKTSLSIDIDGVKVPGIVYHSSEKPEYFLIIKEFGNVWLKLGSPHPNNAEKNTSDIFITPDPRDFTTCSDCTFGGAPILSGSKVTKSVVTWTGGYPYVAGYKTKEATPNGNSEIIMGIRGPSPVLEEFYGMLIVKSNGKNILQKLDISSHFPEANLFKTKNGGYILRAAFYECKINLSPLSIGTVKPEDIKNEEYLGMFRFKISRYQREWVFRNPKQQPLVDLNYRAGGIFEDYTLP